MQQQKEIYPDKQPCQYYKGHQIPGGLAIMVLLTLYDAVIDTLSAVVNTYNGSKSAD